MLALNNHRLLGHKLLSTSVLVSVSNGFLLVSRMGCLKNGEKVTQLTVSFSSQIYFSYIIRVLYRAFRISFSRNIQIVLSLYIFQKANSPQLTVQMERENYSHILLWFKLKTANVNWQPCHYVIIILTPSVSVITLACVIPSSSYHNSSYKLMTERVKLSVLSCLKAWVQ